MESKQPARVFRITHDNNPIDLEDPNKSFSIKDVVNHYSVMYPEITNYVTSKEPFFENDNLIYEINSVVGEHA
jgi:PRTRC genetic system protein C